MKRSQIREVIKSIVQRKLCEAWLTPTSKYGHIMQEPAGNLRSKDPIVQLQGYGNARLSHWKKEVVKRLEEAMQDAKNDNFRNVKHRLDPNGVLNNVVNLINDLDKGQRLEEVEMATTSTGQPVRPVVEPDQDNTVEMSDGDKKALETLQKEQDKLTNDIRRIEGGIQKLLEPLERKKGTLEKAKAAKERKLGTVANRIKRIQDKYSKVS